MMRHGKAAERGTCENDDERELTERGREKTLAVAQGMQKLLKPDGEVVIWTSPLRRAAQTAELVASVIKCREVSEKEAIATGKLEQLHKDLQECSREITLIIIGHEPYLSHWGAIIAGSVLPLKTSAALAITMTSVVPPEGDILWFARPQALGRLLPPEKPVKEKKNGKKK